MKNFKLFSLLAFLFLSFTMMGQKSFESTVIYTPDTNCSQVFYEQDGTWSFDIDINTSLQWSGGNTSTQWFGFIQRTMIATFVDVNTGAEFVLPIGGAATGPFSGGTVTIEKNFISSLPEGQYSMSFYIKYERTHNGSVPVKFTINDNSDQCSQKYIQSDGDFIDCNIKDIFCFTYRHCDDVSIYLYEKDGFVRSTVTSPSTNLTYGWIVRDDNGIVVATGNSDRFQVLDGCHSYELIITDNNTGCVYRQSKTVCTPIEIDIEVQGFCDLGSITNMSSTFIGSGFVLDWNDVVGATYYKIIITTGDPDCCPLSDGGVEYVQTETHSATFFSSGAKNCFSWKVEAYCGPEEKGTTSAKRCSDQNLQEEGDAETRERTEAQTMIAYPNPSVEGFNIELDQVVGESVAAQITDMNGRVVYSSVIKTENKSVNFTWNADANASAGVYFVTMVDSGNMINKKIVVLD